MSLAVLIKPEKYEGLSLEEMGYLLMLELKIKPENVPSSKVTLDVAKEGLIAKGRVRTKQEE